MNPPIPKVSQDDVLHPSQKVMTYHLSNAVLYRKYLGDLDADKSYADAYDSKKTAVIITLVFAKKVFDNFVNFDGQAKISIDNFAKSTINVVDKTTTC